LEDVTAARTEISATMFESEGQQPSWDQSMSLLARVHRTTRAAACDPASAWSQF